MFTIFPSFPKAVGSAPTTHDKATILVALVALSGIGFAVVQFWFPRALEKLLRLIENRKLWVPVYACFLALYLFALACNTAYPGYLEHIEPRIASVSFVLLKGWPLYHGMDATQRYSSFYGPMAYLPYTFALWLLGANVLSLKIVVLLANLLTMILLWRCYRRLLDPAQVWLVIAVIVSYLLTYDYVFQVRGDVLLILSVALGLYAAGADSAPVSVLLLAVACAFAVDIKVTALLYFLPLYALLLRNRGWDRAALAVLVAAGFAFLPFVSSVVSLSRYLEWMHMASREPLTRAETLRTLKFLPFVLAPLAVLILQAKRRNVLAAYCTQNRTFLIVLGASLAAVTIAASKIGAGPHHFLPFYPILGYACADLYKQTTMAARMPSLLLRLNFIPLLWVWVVIAISIQVGTAFPQTVATLVTSRSQASSIANDLEAVMNSHPGKTIEMGYGGWNSTYQLTYFRPALVFAGNPLTVDGEALTDMQLCGITIPHGTLEYLKQCKTQVWLIPKNQEPFSIVNVYSLIAPRLFPVRRLFSDEFRQAFFRHYEKQGSSRYFDIWACKVSS